VIAAVVRYRLAGVRPQAAVAAPPFHAWHAPDGTPWTYFYRSEGGYLVRFPGLADFEVAEDGDAVRGFAQPGVADTTVRHLYVNQVLPLAQSRRGLLVLHASAVVVDDVALAFVGPTGSGKSTLAAWFATHGHPLLADDGVALRRDADGWRILPSDPSVRLWDDSRAALLADDAPVAPGLPFTTKARFLASDEIACASAPTRVARIYMLGPHARELRIDDPGAALMLTGLVRNAFVLDTEERSTLMHQFDALSGLVACGVCRRIEFPRRYTELERVAASILADVGRPVARAIREDASALADA